MEKYDAIYGRQSVEREDSISIESQIEYCQYETRGGTYKVFEDKGYSGKNIERPAFQQMLSAIRRGEVKRVICYKLDRISRSILDFSTMMAEFQTYGVEFVSCTEKFDTASPMGRAMLNICIVFAQLERETIQMRVTDAYMSRSRKGFYMGGRIPYGYQKEPYMIDGKKTSRYVIDAQEAQTVRTIFALYAQPQISFGDVVKYLTEQGIPNRRREDGMWDRGRIAEMIKNPIYVKADLEVYRFYKNQGAHVHNSPENYVGIFGCYLYADKKAGRKQCHLEGQHVVLAPHEGIVPADIWLRARTKCLHNRQISKPIKGCNTWLVGKIKCGKCGRALTIRKTQLKTRTIRYFLCSKRMQDNGCEGVGGLDADMLETFILEQMREHLKDLVTLSLSQTVAENPKVHQIKVRIEQMTDEIEKLLDKVADANGVLMNYIGARVQQLDAQIKTYRQQLGALSPVGNDAKCDVGELKNYMDYWQELSMEDKRSVAEQLIFVVRVTEDRCEITWKF